MDRPVDLLPLICIKCETPIPAYPDEVAWACSRCGQGMILDENQGLLPIEIKAHAYITPGSTGKPYWVVDGKVSVLRKTYGSNRDEEAAAFWQPKRRFMVPAFTCSLDTLLAEGPKLLLQPLELQEGKPAAFEPVTLPARDIHPLVELIVIAIEAARKDRLKEVQLKVDLSLPALWVMP
jgi:hypothetical protein